MARREALQKVALATGIGDKAIAIAYERRRAASKVDETWIARCRNQQEGALAELDHRYGRAASGGGTSMQPEITVAAMLGYLRLRQPETVRAGRYPALEALGPRRGRPAFVSVPAERGRDRGIARRGHAALLRLRGARPRPRIAP